MNPLFYPGVSELAHALLRPDRVAYGKFAKVARHRIFISSVLPFLCITPAMVLSQGLLAGKGVGGAFVALCALLAATCSLAAGTRLTELLAPLFSKIVTPEEAFVGTAVTQIPLFIGLTLLLLPIEWMGLALAYALFTFVLLLITVRQARVFFQNLPTPDPTFRRAAWFGPIVGLCHFSLSAVIWATVGLVAALVGLGLGAAN